MGCDSTIVTDLTVVPESYEENTVTICEGESYTESTSVYDQDGTYTDSYQTGSGCDSIVVTHLSIDPVYEASQMIELCSGESFTVGSSVYTVSGTYVDTFVSSNGCESVITTLLSINPEYAITNVASICEGGSYSEGGSVYTSAEHMRTSINAH